MSDMQVIYTIGHSVRPVDEFIALLEAHGIRQLFDIRTVPRSRRHPHFSREALEVSLPNAGVVYRHAPGLGGLRKPRPDSTNTAWRVAGFRGYADYMRTPQFEEALEQLIAAATVPTTVMCAEAVWWQCHRQLVADALVARRIEVRHIMSPSTATPHTLTSFARVVEERVDYPGLI
jgi:uncharacterized protein (DUF488 family)